MNGHWYNKLVGIAVVCACVCGCTAADEATRPQPTSPHDVDGASAKHVANVSVPSLEMWSLPQWEATQPDFPWLPGEDRERSRSVGGVTHGWLVNAARIPQPHPHIAILDVQWTRDLDYTSDEMLALVESAAEHVAQKHPGAVLQLGNFSADGGGDIPHSVSHNSGRDADLGFYVLDVDGNPSAMTDLGAFEDDGSHVAPDGTVYQFDPARNWALIEGLVEAGQGTIQYIFISNALRKMVLDYARDNGADADTVRHAEIVLGQPGGALAHSDHFHVRIYCSESDVRSGCHDRGRKVPGYADHGAAKRDAIGDATKALASDEADVRLAGVRRLALLEGRQSAAAIAARLRDEDPRVRSAAARALASLGREDDAVARRLPTESDPRVRAELVWALGEFGSKTATRTLIGLLDQPAPVELPSGTTDLRVLVADALSVAEDPAPVRALIALTKSSDGDVRSRAHRALTMLTNHSPAPRPSLHAAWQQWWKKHGDQRREQWLVTGFEARGYEIPRLGIGQVWELTRPILGDDYLSYNAQRVLMRISGRTPASLDWPKTDANFYWRRWFERRWKRLGAPPVPDGMTTLD